MNTQKTGSTNSKGLLTQDFTIPLGGATSAKVDINTGTGNLTIDGQAGVELLVNGTFQYTEKTGMPIQSLDVANGQAFFTLDGKGGLKNAPSFRFPWASCNSAMDWAIHVNPAVPAEIKASSGGGNVKLNMAGMVVTGVTVDSGGGNMEVVLPDNAANLCVSAMTGGGNVAVEVGCCTTGSNTVTATSGAGNVEVRLPDGIAALIHCSSGMGKIIVSPQFSQVDKTTFKSPEYDNAANKVEITAKSGAGNVSIMTK